MSIRNTLISENYHKLANFALFIISFNANIFILISAPSNLTSTYVKSYTCSSALFSILIFIIFTAKIDSKKIKLICTLVPIVFFINLLVIKEELLLFILYPAIILEADYLVTQSISLKLVNIFRLVLILTAIPFLLTDLNFINLIEIRSLILLGFVSFVVSSKKIVMPLKIIYPYKFMALSYIFYTGVLLLFPYISSDSSELKVWYLTTQVGLAVILKIADFSMRESYNSNKALYNMVYAISFTIPILSMLKYPNFIFLSLYFIGYLGLMYATKQLTYLMEVS